MVPLLFILIVQDLTTTSGRFVLPQRNVTELPAQEDAAGSCASFQLGDPSRQELYSPNYPHNYPNHSDCIRILEAPPGHLLKLDFRDEFNVEPSEECRFDYLEIRDGEHGYSPLIGRYCGHQFPPMVTSSSRHLWLRFRSDENIEYSGFRAVYTIVPRPTDGREVEVPPCRLARSGVEGYVNRSDIPPERVAASVLYNVPLDCMWVITVEPGWKISLIFLKFALERPNDCESNFMDVFPERTDLPSRLHNFCGSMAELVASRGNVLHLRFVAEPPAINSSFEILFTAFRDRQKDESCVEGEYDCEDATCISDTLRCNGRANCRFRWDEDDCKSEVNALGRLLQEEHMVIILIIFFMILTGMCSAFVYNCARKLIRDTQMLKEHKEQEKADREEEMCRKMAAATMLPIATISRLSDVSAPSSACPSPRLHAHAHSTPNLRAPCHVPSQLDVTSAGTLGNLAPIRSLPVATPPSQLDVTKLQHVSLEHDRFPRETYVPTEVTVSHCEVQTGESRLRNVFTSVESLMPPPPPPPPPPRIPTVFLETDLDFHPAFQFPSQGFSGMRAVGHSRSDEHLPERCGGDVARRMAPDVIAAH